MVKDSLRKDRLWYFAQRLIEEETKERECSQLDEEHSNKIRIKFSQLVNNLTCLGDIASHLLENEKLTWKEYESIQHLQPTAILANEELLRIIASKSRDVYDCFLSALKKTNQVHLHRILQSPIDSEDWVETSGEEHKDVICRNFTWLSDNLDSENGLITCLYEKQVLSLREKERIGCMCDRFRKNELLLTVIRRKSSDDFKKFLCALEDTNQSHIVSKLRTPQDSSVRITTKDNVEVPKMQLKTVHKSIFPCSPTPKSVTKKFRPPVPPRKARPSKKPKPEVTLNESTEIAKESHRLKKVKIIRDEHRLNKLENQLQTEISIKVICIRQRTVKRSEDILKFCERRVLQESLQTKRKDSQIAAEMEQLNRKISQYSAAVSLNNTLRAEITSMKEEIKSQNDFILKTNSDREKLRNNLDLVKEETINEKLRIQQLEDDKFQSENKLKKVEEKLRQCDENEKKCLERLHETEEKIRIIRLTREEECKELDLKMKSLEAERDELYKKNEKLILENDKYIEIEKQLILSEENGRELLRQVEESRLNLRICDRQKNGFEKNQNLQNIQKHLIEDGSTEAEEELEKETRYRKELSGTLEKLKKTQAELDKTTNQLSDVLDLNNELRLSQQANTTVWTNNHQFLVENIDSSRLSDILCSRKCITAENQDRINRRASEEDFVKCLKFAARKCENNRFIIFQSLRETNQTFLAKVLESEGVVVKSKITIKVVISTKFPFLSKSPTPEKTSLFFNEWNLVDKLNRLASQSFHEGESWPPELSDLVADGIHIAPYCRQEDCGIVVWFWCTSQDALRVLREIYVSGVLFDRMSDLFKKLTKSNKDSPSSPGVNLTLTSLTIFQHDLTKQTDANLEFSGYENDPVNLRSLLNLGYHSPK